MAAQYWLHRKKGGKGLHICVDSHTLIANVVVDMWLLPCINELLSQLWGC